MDIHHLPPPLWRWWETHPTARNISTTTTTSSPLGVGVVWWMGMKVVLPTTSIHLRNLATSIHLPT